MAKAIKVTVWNEYRHEKKNEAIGKIYPNGMHGAIADALNAAGGINARTATLDEPEHGLTEKVLADTDVLIWWGHMAHGEVADAVVDRVQQHVISGMGIVLLHSAHFSKIFRRLMGTTCSLKWREVGEREILWQTKPGHPILDGVPDPVIIEHTEMYGEFFDVPEPEVRLDPRGRQGLLLPPRARDLPHLPRSRHPEGAHQRRPLDGAGEAFRGHRQPPRRDRVV